LWRLNFSTVTELPLLSGRRADIVALAMDATIWIVENKSSIRSPESGRAAAGHNPAAI
jgi:hypothetical protein